MKLSLLQWVLVALLVWAGVATGCAVKYRADARVAGADGAVAGVREDVATQGARDAASISDANLAARQACESEMARVAGENQAALQAAENKRAAAEAELEEYLDRLANQPTGCEAFLQAEVCPSLMDY